MPVIYLGSGMFVEECLTFWFPSSKKLYFRFIIYL